MLSRNTEEGFPLGSASEFHSKVGGDPATPTKGALLGNDNHEYSAAAVYKTSNYRMLEGQLKRRLQVARDFLNKAELTPQDSHATASLDGALSDAVLTVSSYESTLKALPSMRVEAYVHQDGKRTRRLFTHTFVDAHSLAGLQQLDLEARGSPCGQTLAAEVAAYAEQLRNLRQHSDVISSRMPLVDTPGAHLTTRDLENVSSRLIGECNTTALHTEDLGIYIMQHLRSQRDTILKTSRLAEATGAEGARGRHTIVKMIRNHWLNRALLTGTIVMLAVCILLVLVHKSKLFRFSV